MCMFISHMTKDDELRVCTVSQKLQTVVKTLFITVFSPFYMKYVLIGDFLKCSDVREASSISLLGVLEGGARVERQGWFSEICISQLTCSMCKRRMREESLHLGS